ncbi:MAG: DUF6261 family protein [Bacteroidia bacterium]|nr:DUF6261 family protein [Bacteroidia bacterium]
MNSLEEATKTQLLMAQVRLEIDEAYRQITKRINAQIVINGEVPYKVFVDELNQRIDFYGNNAAIRSGQNAKDNPPPASEN